MRTTAASCVFGLVALFLGYGASRSASLADAADLEPCTAGERQIGGTEVHACGIWLDVGQHLRVRTTHLGADVATVLLGPGGDHLLRVDYPGSRRGMMEPLDYVARTAGRYRLEIALSGENNPAGRYRFDLWPPRPADASDISRAAGVAAYARGRERAREARRAKRAATDASWATAAGVLESAVLHWQAAGDLVQAAFAWEELARVRAAQRQMEQALEAYRRAFEILLEAEHPRLIQVASHYGSKAMSQNLPELAVVCYEEQKRAAKRWGTLLDQGIALQSLARALRELGREDAALRRYEEALGYYAQSSDPKRRAATLGSIGRLFTGIGEHQRAISFLEAGLSLQERLNLKSEMVVTLNTLGDAERRLGQIDASLGRFDRVLKLLGSRQLAGESASACRRRGVALLGLARGTAARSSDRRSVRKARGLFKRTLDNLAQCSTRQLREEAITLGGLGMFYVESGRPAAGLDDLHQALQLRQKQGQSGFGGQASAHYALARAFLALNDLPEGRRQIQQAIELVESLWQSKRSRPLRSAYLQDKQQYYDLYVEILMNMAQGSRAQGANRLAVEIEALALEVSGRRRGRTLSERLHTPAVDLTPNDPELRRREERLWSEMLKLEQQYDPTIGTAGGPERRSLVKRQLDRLYLQFDVFETEARSQAPEFRLRRPAPRLEAIQQLLDEDTILLEYSLGERASFVWKVGHDSFSAHWLEPKDQLEGRARRVYELLSISGRRPIVAQRREQALAELSTALFPPSLATELTPKRLAVVKDGALHFVPFGVLPMPSGHPSATAAPLVLNHEIVNLPSAGVLRQLRGLLPEGSAVNPSLAVFADAAYIWQAATEPGVDAGPPADPLSADSLSADRAIDRLEASNGAPNDLREVWSVAEDAFLGEGYSQLHASRAEGEAILRLAPGSSRGYFATDVHRAAVLHELEDSGYLHFAVHGYNNPVRPEHSSLVLSRFDAEGREVQSLLSARDIYRTSLVAELVVLSSCGSGLGREVRGEGLVGLTQAFLGAGAQRVIVSLWNIDDAPASEFMQHFYTELFTNQRSAADALRVTQVWMRRQTRWREPRFWAGFVLHGEWR